MVDTEYLKEKIKLEQEKLNRLLNGDEDGILSWDKTTEMSRELDKLIVEYLKFQKYNNL